MVRGRPGTGLKLMVRRLNLLPTSDIEVAGLLSQLMAPVGARGTALLNVGLWYGPLSRQRAFGDGGDEAQRRALRLLDAGVSALVRVACSATGWPRILWREQLPQHFATQSGRYSVGASPLPVAAATLVRPVTDPLLRGPLRHPRVFRTMHGPRSYVDLLIYHAR